MDKTRFNDHQNVLKVAAYAESAQKALPSNLPYQQLIYQDIASLFFDVRPGTHTVLIRLLSLALNQNLL
jgi:hypothetical protein